MSYRVLLEPAQRAPEGLQNAEMGLKGVRLQNCCSNLGISYARASRAPAPRFHPRSYPRRGL